MRKQYQKPALNYKQQLQKLKQRGLIIENESKARHLLETISYYRLSGYWYPLLKDKENHHFKENASFESAFKLYKFDRELRLLMLRELEKIEVGIRAKMIYILSHNKNTFWYTESNHFINPVSFGKTLTKMHNEYKKNDDQFINAFKKKYYDTIPPSWIMLEITSFGSLSYLYQNLKPCKSKTDIANFFGLNEKVFSSWLHSLVYLRNVCAHHSRLWNRTMSIQPMFPKKPKNQWLTHSNILNNKVYFFFSMILYLLNTINPGNSAAKRIVDLLEEFPSIDLKAMGFPDSWRSETLWINK